MIITFFLDCSPVIRACKMIICSIAIECRSEYLRIGIDRLYDLRNFNGLFGKLCHRYRIRVNSAVCMLPQCRLIVKTIALHAGRCGRISEILDEIIDILIHINNAVRQIRCIRKCTALGENDLIPAIGWCGFFFGNSAVCICRNIACELQCGKLVSNVIFFACR